MQTRKQFRGKAFTALYRSSPLNSIYQQNEKWTWNLSVAMIQKDKHTQKSLRDHVAQVKFTAINLGRGKHLDTTEILLNKQNEWTGGLSLNVTLWTAEHGLKLVVEITMFHRFIKEPLPIAKLRDMLAGNMTLDTRFLAFSKRLHNEGGDHGKTCAAAPRAVFANSDLLVSSSPYFKASASTHTIPQRDYDVY